jgi:hypothetical protein
VKPIINSVEVHPQLSNNGHPVDGRVNSHPSVHHEGGMVCGQRNSFLLGSSSLANYGG